MASAVVFRWLEELGSLTKTLLLMLHLLSSRRKASYDCLFPHGGVVRLHLAISRAVPHLYERVLSVRSIRRPSIKKCLKGCLKARRQAGRGFLLAS